MVDDKIAKITTAGSRLAILLHPDVVEALGWEKGTVVQLHYFVADHNEFGNTLTIRKLLPLKV